MQKFEKNREAIRYGLAHWCFMLTVALVGGVLIGSAADKLTIIGTGLTCLVVLIAVLGANDLFQQRAAKVFGLKRPKIKEDDE